MDKKKKKSSKKFSGSFKIETEEERKKAVGYILEHLEDLSESGTKVASINASPFGKPKSFEQLELFHSIVLDSFSESSGANYSRTWWKHRLKEQFLERPKLDENDRPMIRKDGSSVTEIPSLASLKRNEMSDFINNVLELHFELFYTEIIIKKSQ